MCWPQPSHGDSTARDSWPWVYAKHSTESWRLARRLLLEIPVPGASALREARLGHASALRTTAISGRCFCWSARDARHQPPAGSLGVLLGQQQPLEGQEDSSRAGLRARVRPDPSCAGHSQPGSAQALGAETAPALVGGQAWYNPPKSTENPRCPRSLQTPWGRREAGEA